MGILKEFVKMAASQSPRSDLPGNFRFEFDSSNNILLLRLAGTVTPQLVADIYQDIQHHWISTGARADIVDISSVTQVLLNSDMIRSLAKQDHAPELKWRITVLVTPHPETFGLARMFQITAESKNQTVHVAHTLHEAYALLGIQAARFQPLASPSDEGRRAS